MIYDIAGLRIAIENKYEYTDRFCCIYLSDDQTSPADIVASVLEEEFLEERKTDARFSDGYIENICLYRSICRQMPARERMLLHAAVLEYKGKAYAFLGRSGAGKSTHTGLWLKYIEDAKIVNGDKPILQAVEYGFIAHGTPWMGKEGRGCNASVPLAGLCFLEKAERNEIRRLTPAEAVSRIFSQILFPQDEENATKTLELTDKLIRETPAYLLKCTISEEAVEKSFTEMTGEQYTFKK